MASYKYLIIGAGMTADAAVRGIRELDTDGCNWDDWEGSQSTL